MPTVEKMPKKWLRYFSPNHMAMKKNWILGPQSNKWKKVKRAASDIF